MKAHAVIESGLTPIICIGESREEYEEGKTSEILSIQIVSLAGITGSALVAYEPIWAIGTGLQPTIAEINDAHDYVFGEFHISMLYGGSVTLDNYSNIMALERVRGILVGSESLKVQRFVKMVLSEPQS
jgi:triosephosphate isomerase